jgi:hypothetical protein
MLSLFWIEGRMRCAPYCWWSLLWLLGQYLTAFVALRALGVRSATSKCLCMCSSCRFATSGRCLRGDYSLRRLGSSRRRSCSRSSLPGCSPRWRFAGQGTPPSTSGGPPPRFCRHCSRSWSSSLSLLSSREEAGSPPRPRSRCARAHHGRAFEGAFAGMGLTVLAVALSTLVFGVYGTGLFVASPLIIGAVTAYIGNYRRRYRRGGDVGAGQECGRTRRLGAPRSGALKA